MKFTSPSFTKIPKIYTCDGKNILPTFEWKNPPKNTVTYALLVDDPDSIHVSGKITSHFIVSNIPNLKLTEKDLKQPNLLFYQNDIGSKKYVYVKDHSWHGPCPPKGDKPHNYRFTVYALNHQTPPFEGRMTREIFEHLFKKYIIDKATLYATYKR